MSTPESRPRRRGASPPSRVRSVVGPVPSVATTVVVASLGTTVGATVLAGPVVSGVVLLLLGVPSVVTLDLGVPSRVGMSDSVLGSAGTLPGVRDGGRATQQQGGGGRDDGNGSLHGGAPRLRCGRPRCGEGRVIYRPARGRGTIARWSYDRSRARPAVTSAADRETPFDRRRI